METDIKLSECIKSEIVDKLSLNEKIRVVKALIEYIYCETELRVFDLTKIDDTDNFKKLFGAVAFSEAKNNNIRYVAAGDNTDVDIIPDEGVYLGVYFLTDETIDEFLKLVADWVGYTIVDECVNGGWDGPLQRVIYCLNDDYIFGKYFDWYKFFGEEEVINVCVTRSYSIPKNEYEKAKETDFKEYPWLTQTINIKSPDEK